MSEAGGARDFLPAAAQAPFDLRQPLLAFCLRGVSVERIRFFRTLRSVEQLASLVRCWIRQDN